jgi:hypothetical protein
MRDETQTNKRMKIFPIIMQQGVSSLAIKSQTHSVIARKCHTKDCPKERS